LAERFRLVAFDLRGHGMSDAPLEQERYTDARLWAGDIAAIIEQLRLAQPVLVGWSYGGFIIGDYLRAFGQQAVAGIVFVGAAVTLDQSALGTLIGPGFLDHVPGATSEDFPTNIAAIRDLLRACTARPLSAEDYETALCWNIIVPARVRAALLARQVNSDDVLATLKKPLLVVQGESDRLILRAMAEHILATCPTAKASWYAETGHAPFLEDTSRFNRELAEFAAQSQAGPRAQ
jgi:pimeloyl-ACP methyl ester carboxylesterase